MKLNQVIVKVIETDTADGLTVQVNTFLAGAGEATLLQMLYSTSGGVTAAGDMVVTYSVMIVYTN